MEKSKAMKRDPKRRGIGGKAARSEESKKILEIFREIKEMN